MSDSLRAGLSIFFGILLFLGLILAFIPENQNIPIQLSGQTATCTINYSEELSSNQTIQENCQASQNNWLVLSLKSQHPLMFGLWFNSTSSTRTELYNRTDTVFSLDVPVFSAGTIQSVALNQGNSSNTINGSLTVFAQTSTTVVTQNTVYSYRLYGGGFIGLSSIALFVLIWNPKKITTRGLARIKSKLRKTKTDLSEE